MYTRLAEDFQRMCQALVNASIQRLRSAQYDRTMSEENPDGVGEEDTPDSAQASPFESEVELIRDTENLLVFGDSRA